MTSDRNARRTTGWLITAAILLVACAGPPQPEPTRMSLPPDRVALPDHPPCRSPEPSVPCIEVGGAVQGTLMADGDCVWLVRDNGNEVRIVWPFGYSRLLEPFAVFDHAGRLVAGAGDFLLAEGSEPAEGEADACGRTTFVVLADGMGVIGKDFNSQSIAP